ncbi:hypothetical protein ACGFSB_21940 [Streptomyces sp. NPDC048441]|uniref:hypothetical protein n=1 Tax=Streptomyces sp. NPDC048441 TaxID=3365552 RepID=UPI0037196159
MTYDLGEPDPADSGPVIEAVNKAYGTGPNAYEANVRRRDRCTLAITDALAASDAHA